MGRPAINLTNQVFGRLTVLRKYENEYPNRWICQCTCGKIKIVAHGNLKSGHTVSCGCLRKERVSETQTSHGLSDTPEYKTWQSMKTRCYDPSHLSFARYGGRGIQVCDRWRHSFENFYTDMGPKPGPEYSIDRNDNNGPYEKSNCRWATRIEQMNNCRINRKVIYQGREMTLAQLAREYNVNYAILYRRIKDGWAIEEALTSPVRISSK